MLISNRPKMFDACKVLLAVVAIVIAASDVSQAKNKNKGKKPRKKRNEELIGLLN